MKKILLVILVLIVLVILGVVFFVATFNADKYRPLLVKKVEEATGKKVSLDRIALVWKNGIALEAKNFKLYSGSATDSKVVAQIENATALIRLAPLLHRDVQVASVTLVRPLVGIAREKDGVMLIAGIRPPATGESKAGAVSPDGPGVLWSIDSVRIEGGEVAFHDLSGPAPVELGVKQLDLTIRNFSLTQPVSFESRAALLSEKQNISVNGTLQLPQKEKTGLLESFSAKSDLALLNMSEAAKAFPVLKTAGLGETLAGVLEITVGRMGLDPQGIQSAKADVTLKGGSVTLRPTPGTAGPLKSDLKIQDLDVTLKGLSLTDPFSFDAQGAILSQKQNISAQGQFQLPQKDRAGLLGDLAAETDLGLLYLPELFQVFPDLKAAGLKDRLSGDLKIKVRDLSLDTQGPRTARGELHLRGANFSLIQQSQPVEQLNADAFYENEKLVLKDVSCQFAGGDIKISGTVDQPMGRPLSNLRLSAHELVLKELMPVAEGKTGLTGALSVDFEGKFSGKQWPEISQSLSGEGRLMLKDGLLLNCNILRIVVEKIARIPLIGETLLDRFPPEYKQDLDEPSTILKPVEMLFSVSDGKVSLPELAAGTGLFDITGSGQVGFDKSVNGNFLLRMNPMLSQALVKAASQVQLLENAKGQVEIPLTVQGVMPNAAVLPDVEYLTSKIVTAKAQEAVTNIMKDPQKDLGKQLSGLFDKKSASATEGGALPPASESVPTDAGAAPAASSEDDPFAGLINKALKN